MPSKEYFSNLAQMSRRIARNMTDPAIARRLEAIGEDFEQQAAIAPDFRSIGRPGAARCARTGQQRAHLSGHPSARAATFARKTCLRRLARESAQRRESDVELRLDALMRRRAGRCPDRNRNEDRGGNALNE